MLLLVAGVMQVRLLYVIATDVAIYAAYCTLPNLDAAHQDFFPFQLQTFICKQG